MKSENTMFAPAERADAVNVEHHHKQLLSTGIIDHVTRTIPSIMLILNRHRQAVYANQRLLELLGISTDESILGKRPGEILSCIHAYESAPGCGTTHFCRECGAVRAILKSQRENIAVTEECRITTRTGEAFEFRVWASPFDYLLEKYTVFTVLDISHEKRREVLEQTFFHDVSNILAGIVGYSDLIPSMENSSEISRSVGVIRKAASELASEIDTQKKLLDAEDNRLEVNPDDQISSFAILNELADTALRWWPEVTVARECESTDFTVRTDHSLLYRVLLNMVKNGVEASSAGGAVTLGCFTKGNSGVFTVHNQSLMTRSVQRQVFQRSFSTRGKGRGIGAYSMKLFGEKYLNGHVWFKTSQLNGTSFFFSLPLHSQQG